jgi:hypothetical protein
MLSKRPLGLNGLQHKRPKWHIQLSFFEWASEMSTASNSVSMPAGVVSHQCAGHYSHSPSLVLLSRGTFTHIYCTSCKAINFAKREANVITCGVCNKPVLRLDDNEHGECETCGLQSLEHKSLDSEDVSGQFLGGDILCDSCKLILAKVYKQKPGDSGQKNNAPGFG